MGGASLVPTASVTKVGHSLMIALRRSVLGSFPPQQAYAMPVEYAAASTTAPVMIRPAGVGGSVSTPNVVRYCQTTLKLCVMDTESV